MPGPMASRKRRGKRGPCSYCGKVHRRGKRRGDSCGGTGEAAWTKRDKAN